MAGLGAFDKNDGPPGRPRAYEPFGCSPSSNPSSRSPSSSGVMKPLSRSTVVQPPPWQQRTRPRPESLSNTHKMQFLNGAAEPKHVRATPLGLNISPPRPGSRPKSPVNDAKSPSPQRASPIVSYADIYDAETVPAKPSYSNAPKRSRSPPIPSSDVSLATSFPQVSSEREMQAKAKRLARFNVELNQQVPKLQDIPRLKSIGNESNEVLTDKGYDVRAQEAQGLAHCGSKSADVIVGLCPDMCPEAERDERERKGDLDKYERLDGERNQTSKFLAVKKYNRTAERDADLIRPMPVLQKTVDYLLDLLGQPYGDNFLGVYNFLWDRMRAIRMDLRMQHIFNQDAITMLEQMIRLHISAMHELCEYKKGEGFSEGFDAHLNIEQMNKTSVELFQMYDDHRKRGQCLPTEKEFRGYYALLKLDRHPGYKVEPAELSLDLAKMAPEIRSSPDILFARDVARSCRMGNYIAFFRLARKATYLQACLMHAHFSKIRTQALASLHSGLQHNQGIPVQHVLRWLGMEGEDIESFLEYHGFMLRSYEELYMVKEGPLLNRDTDFPTRRSQLVNLKKSRKIMDDVYSGQAVSFIRKEQDIVMEKTDITGQRVADSSIEDRDKIIDEPILDIIVTDFGDALQPLPEGSSPAISYRGNEDEMTEVPPVGASYVHVDNFISEDAQQAEDEQMVEPDQIISEEQIASTKLSESLVQAGTYKRPNSECIDNSVTPSAACISFQNEISGLAYYQKEKLNSEKLKQILRKWKQQTSMLREMRERKRLLATAALSSLSLGPPIQKFNTKQLSRVGGDLDINFVARERHGRQEKSWSRLNVSEVVSPTLLAKNPGSKCICWKLVIHAQSNDAESHSYHLALRWLQSKLMGNGIENDDELMVSLSQLSIWKKWSETQTSLHQILSLAIIREVIFGKNQFVPEDYSTAGASCILFLVSGAIPWELQRARLCNIVMSVPPGSSLPLLIISTDALQEDIGESSSSIIDLLGLHFVDKMRIDSFRVVFLAGNCLTENFNGFFVDDHLRDSLQWLASHSPRQPPLCMVKTGDLILSYLRHSLAVLENLDASEVGPNHCISAFNEALDRSGKDILAAASMNPISWPSFEVGLLEKSSNEQMFARMFLPTIGWSSAARVEPLIRAIKACKLPNYADDLSWLHQGSHVVAHIQNQKLALEKSLINYLTQSTMLFKGDMAAREACVMLQKGARLELSGSSYHIVPKWAVIFRRIYNWQLMKLSKDKFSKAYILESLDGSHDSNPVINNAFGKSLWSSNILKDMGSADSEKHLGHNPFLTEPSLDEMLEVVSNGPALQKLPSDRWPAYSSSGIENHDSGHTFEISNNFKTNDEQHSNGYKTDDEQHGCNTSAVNLSISKERNKESALPVPVKADKFSKLLEQCNHLQDMIDEKLAIYF